MIKNSKITINSSIWKGSLKNTLLVRNMHRKQCRTLCKTCFTPEYCKFSLNFENYKNSEEFQIFLSSVQNGKSLPANLNKINNLLDKAHTLKRYKVLNLNFNEASNIIELLEHLPNKSAIDLLESTLMQRKLNPNFNLLNVTDLGVLFASLISAGTLYLAYENHVKNNSIPPVVKEQTIVNNTKVINDVPLLPRPCQLPIEKQGKVIRFLMSHSIIPKINFILPRINIIFGIIILCYIFKILNNLPFIVFN